jgi:hypothetical protein
MPKISQKTRLEPPKQHEGWTIRFYFSTTNHFDPSLLGKKHHLVVGLTHMFLLNSGMHHFTENQHIYFTSIPTSWMIPI